ncbi:MAG: trigger factor [Clostridia bacterium]|nr:trigger factor [Clostridia bacterium]
MEYKVEKAEKSTVKVEISLNATEWRQAQVDAYNKNKSKFSMPGFRKGKVPMAMIERTYGKGVFFEDAINESFPKYFDEVLAKETSIDMVGRPDLDVKSLNDDGIVLVATVPVKPEVKLGDYKGIKFEKVEYNVTDEDIENDIKRLQERNSRTVEVEGRPAKMGDISVIDYSGSVDGVKFDGGTAENQELILGSKNFIPGFEEGVVGMNIGEEKDIAVKFPEEYHAENLKGKDAVFAVKLNALKVKELPEVTDEFIKDATGTDTVDAYKAEAKAKMEENNAKRAERELENKMIEFITDASEVEIPDALIESQIDYMVQDMEYRMSYQGLKLEDFLKYTNQTMEDYRKSFKDQASKSVKQQLVIDAIINKEGIVASDDEIKVKVDEMYAKNGKDVPEFKDFNAKQFDYIKQEIIINKLFDVLKKENTIA